MYDIHNQAKKQKGGFTHIMKHSSGMVAQLKHEVKQVHDMLGILAQLPIEMIIELGTNQGGFTKLLEDVFPRTPIHTFDITNMTSKSRQYFKHHVHFHVENILDESDTVIGLLCNPTAKLLYCDNGNKVKEVEIYSQYLFTGDYLAVHDWGNEIFWEDVQPHIGEWEQIGWKTLEHVGSTTRIWRKTVKEAAPDACEEPIEPEDE